MTTINWFWIILGILNLQLSWLYRSIRWQMQIEAIDRRYALRDLWAASIAGVAAGAAREGVGAGGATGVVGGLAAVAGCVVVVCPGAGAAAAF